MKKLTVIFLFILSLQIWAATPVVINDAKESVIDYIQKLEQLGLVLKPSKLIPSNLMYNNGNGKFSPGEIVMLLSRESFHDVTCMMKSSIVEDEAQWLLQSQIRYAIDLPLSQCLSSGDALTCFIRPVKIVDHMGNNKKANIPNITLFEINPFIPNGVQVLCRRNFVSDVNFSFVVGE